MEPKKRTPRKKAEPKQEKQPVYAFPLDDGHYFSSPVTSRNSTSMSGHVASIRKVVGLPPSTVYTHAVGDAVGQWQQDHDLPLTRVVDQRTWDAMFNA